jgi:hypothetical protein
MSRWKLFQKNREEVAFRGLHTTERLRSILRRERELADRFGGGFSLLTFAPRNQEDHLAALVHLAQALKKRLRFSDEVGWLDDQHTQIGVVMHRTPAAAAAKVAEEVCQAFPPRITAPACTVSSYPSGASSGHDLGEDAAGQAPGQESEFSPLRAATTPK